MGLCCPLPATSSVRGFVEKERSCLFKGYTIWKNNRLPPQNLFPSKHPKANNPSTSCQLCSRMLLESLLLLKLPSFGICRWLQHDFPGSLAGSWSQPGFRHLSRVCGCLAGQGCATAAAASALCPGRGMGLIAWYAVCSACWPRNTMAPKPQPG